MANETLNQVNKQVEALVVEPARGYVGLALDHFEKLANAQYEQTKAYTETTLRQARAALDIRNPADFQGFVDEQQKLAQELRERLKGDAEKFVTLSQEFAQKAQSLTENNVRKTSSAASSKAK